MTLGEKIQKLRKQSGLSQEALAEKLTVTRQTISKWELDQSTPDLAFLTRLCDLFGVSADYLIREDMDEPGAVPEPARREKKLHFTELAKRRGLTALSAAAFVAIFVCLICDYFTSQSLTWSLTVTASVAAAWLLCLPCFLAKGKVVLKTLLTASLVVIPYLALLSCLLKNPLLFKLGTCISLVSLVAVWVMYAISRKCRSRLWRAFGLALLVIIPMTILDNHIVAAFVANGELDASSDLFNSIITFLLAFLCFGMDYLQRRKSADCGAKP